MLTGYQIFRGLQNSKWSFHRAISNAGVAIGTAQFTLISENELFYEESGVFTTNSQVTLPITKQYYFVLNSEGKIEKHFSQDAKKTGLFYVFSDKHTGDHLCVRDKYKAIYEFPDNEQFINFNLTYEVKGPSKDYSACTSFSKLTVS